MSEVDATAAGGSKVAETVFRRVVVSRTRVGLELTEKLVNDSKIRACGDVEPAHAKPKSKPLMKAAVSPNMSAIYWRN